MNERLLIFSLGRGSSQVACFNNQYHIINYFIFDCGIERTKYIEEWLINGKREDIMKIFNKRDLGKKLQLDLNNKLKKDIKIKL